MTPIERCCRTALALLLATSLVGIVPAWAGTGDEPPLPGDGQPVVAGPGETAAASSSSSSGGGAVSARDERRLPSGTVPEKWSIGGAELTTRELLDQLDQAMPNQTKTELLARVDDDLAITRDDLGIDLFTRGELKKIDGRYIALQAALAERGEGESSRVAVFDTNAGPAAALREIYEDPSMEPRRFGFISRIDSANLHSATGDLYVDKLAGVVSLVLWDNMASSSADTLMTSMREAVEGGQAEGQQTRFVVSYQTSTVLALNSGCWQCALRFADDMLEQDHHTEQVSEARMPRPGEAVAVTSKAGPASLPQRSLLMSTSRSGLKQMLVERVKQLLEDQQAGRMQPADLAQGMAQVRGIVAAAQQERQTRLAPFPPPPARGEPHDYYLRIDRLRTRDIEAVRAALADDPRAFLERARDLNQQVLRDAVDAGRDQQDRLARSVEPAHPAGDEPVVSAVTSSHAAAVSTAAAEDMSGEAFDIDVDFSDSGSDDGEFLPISAAREDQEPPWDEDGALPGTSLDEALIEGHDKAQSFRDEAVRMVDALFEQVEAEGRGAVDRDADRPDDNDEADEAGRQELVAER